MECVGLEIRLAGNVCLQKVIEKRAFRTLEELIPQDTIRQAGCAKLSFLVLSLCILIRLGNSPNRSAQPFPWYADTVRLVDSQEDGRGCRQLSLETDFDLIHGM